MLVNKAVSVIAVIVVVLLGGHLFTGQDTMEIESFDLLQAQTEQPMETTTDAATESVYSILTVTNTHTTGHGNVLFKVLWYGVGNHYQILIWSKFNYSTGQGYRQWFEPTNRAHYFGTWFKRGGALPVGWPPNYTGMNKSMQLIDVDGDGDLDVFQLVEAAPEVWTVYLYKNSNITNGVKSAAGNAAQR